VSARPAEKRKEWPALEQVRQLPRFHREAVPEDWLDEMGHMNVRWYVHLYSRAMRGLFASFGLDLDYFRERRAGTFALKQYIEYRAEVLVGDEISLHPRVAGRSEKRIHVVNFLVNDTRGAVASTLETVATHVDLEARRSAPFPPEIRERIERLAEEHARLGWEPPLCGVMEA